MEMFQNVYQNENTTRNKRNEKFEIKLRLKCVIKGPKVFP